MLIRLADEMGFKIATFQHVLEGYKVADEIAAHGAGASTFSDWWGYKVEAEDAIPYNAAHDAQARRARLDQLRQRRARAPPQHRSGQERCTGAGSPKTKRWRWSRSIRRSSCAIDSRVGSLEVGKDADVVIWNKHPLSTYAIADRVYIDGQLYYDRLADERRLTDARTEKTQLAAAEGRSAPTADPQRSPQATQQSAQRTQARTFGKRRRRPRRPAASIGTRPRGTPGAAGCQRAIEPRRPSRNGARSSPSPTRASTRSRSRRSSAAPS